MHRTRNAAYSQGYRGFESLPLRHSLVRQRPSISAASVASAGATGGGRRRESYARSYEEAGPELSIFLERDHGALLQVAGGRRNAIQYEIGNPLTASKMTRHRLAAALYAPLRVVLYADAEGRAVLEYDKPSSLFGQFADDRVTEIGRSLDAALEAALRKAAGRS